MNAIKAIIACRLPWRATLLATVFSGLAFPGAGLAQIATDGSMGAAVSLTGPHVAIPADLGTQRGGNLFHSFSTFSVPTSGSATFQGPTTVSRVIGRVTGGAVSNIDGKLAADIPGADVYLINPAGMVFGPNATLAVSGAFHASTASEIRFPDSGVYDAANPARSALSVAEPSAFGFAANPAALTSNGARLTGAAGATLSLSGGDVTINGGAVSAEVGRINLSAAGAGASMSLADGAISRNGGAVRVAGDARVSARGDGGGTIAIRGGALEVTGGARVRADTTGGRDNRGGVTVAADKVTVSDRGQISANTESGGRGGVVDITAKEFNVLGDGATVQTLVMARSTAAATGAAGVVKVAADKIALRFGGNITASSLGRGDAGAVEIKGGSILLSHDDSGVDTGTGIFSLSSSTSGGSAGRIDISGESLEVYGGGQISTRTGSSKAAGTINVQVDRLVLSGHKGQDSSQIASQNTAGASGDAGSISIVAKSVVVTDGAHITSKTRGAGKGGSIRIVADSILLSAGYPDVDSGVSGGATASATGDGGEISIEAGAMTIASGAAVSTATSAPGNAGAVRIAAGSLTIDGAGAPAGALTGVQSSARGANAGAGGAVAVTAGRVEIANGGAISASAEGKGAAGNIAVTASDSIVLRSGGAVSTSTVNSNGGDIALAAGTLIYAASGLIATSVSGGVGDGGNITIARPLLAVSNQAAILASAFGGDGGRIVIAADNVLASTGTRIDASSTLGVSGAVNIQSPDSELANSLAPLSSDFVDPARLLRADCADRDPAAASRLTIAPHDPQFRAKAEKAARTAQRAAARGDLRLAAAAYERALAALDAMRGELAADPLNSADFFRDTVEPTHLGYADALLRLAERADGAAAQGWLQQALTVMERLKAAELDDYFQDDCVAALERRRRSITQLAPGVAAIYPILLPDRTELLVAVGDRLERVRVPVGRAELTKVAHSFRALLEKRATHQYREPAKKLHDWLIRPLAPLLQAASVDTLALAPDGPLRAIPLAALFDGERFLIERYAVAITPGLTLIDPKPLKTGGKALLAGLSEATQGFAPLPHAAAELTALGRMLDAKPLLNKDFSAQALSAALRRDSYDIVHIATHGQFSADHRGSFLVTGDGQISMERLEGLLALGRFRARPVELLVLSACQTAAGDARAALGLAGVALKAGVRSAVASLWRVDDAASSDLMQTFYRHLLQDGATKAQALRRAQHDMLQAEPRWRHPYYWGSYLVIGNWL